MTGELPLHPSDEERLASVMARELEMMTTTTAVQPSDGFADRVMLAIADEPLPQPVRAFGVALLGGHLRAAASAVGDAWRTLTSTPAPLLVRAQALALVLVVLVSSLALTGGATVGALGLLGNGPTTPAPSGPPSQPAPTRSPAPTPSEQPEDTPSTAPEESTSAEPTDTPEAIETQDSHEIERPTVRPGTATPTETDDHGGDSGSGSGSGSGETPQPTETDDHSGSDG